MSRRARARFNLAVQDDIQAACSRYMAASDDEGALVVEDMERDNISEDKQGAIFNNPMSKIDC